MTQGCIGCGEKPVNMQRDIAIKEAEEYGKKQNIPVALYREGGEWKYCNAYQAFEAGLPVEHVVYQHLTASAE